MDLQRTSRDLNTRVKKGPIDFYAIGHKPEKNTTTAITQSTGKKMVEHTNIPYGNPIVTPYVPSTTDTATLLLVGYDVGRLQK
jgi:hypothetical protein